MKKEQLLLTSVFGPYGVKNEYAEGLGMQMELLNNQITREQGIHSPRQSYWSFGLYLLAINIFVPTTILDFPSWNDFTKELKKGYTHIGISFIVPNVAKVARMTEYIRENHPEIKIILGGYGTVIPEIEKIVSFDELCIGEGVSWLRKYFGENPEAPIKHPSIHGPAYESIYGFRSKPKGSILMTGLGCNNGCIFCITTHLFKKKYIPLLDTGKDILKACDNAKDQLGSTGFTIMDENFLKKPIRARQLLEEMTKNKKPYVFDIFSSAEVVKEVGVDFLVRLGVRMVWIGVESKFNSHEKTKGIDLKSLFNELQSKGITVIASTILFQDHHDQKTIQEEIDWVISLGSNLVQFMNYTPIPTTVLYDSLKKQDRLKDIDYRFQNGAGELCFEHPHFNDPNDQRNYLRNAFKQKFEDDGPGIVNMAITAITGYKNAKQDYEIRQQNGFCWNKNTLTYEKTDNYQSDEFMELRIRKMQKIALNLRPTLLAAKKFAPNKAAKEKAQHAIDLYNEVLGPPDLKTKIGSILLTCTAIKETGMLKIAKIMGNESIIYQPSVKKTYNKAAKVLNMSKNKSESYLFIKKTTFA